MKFGVREICDVVLRAKSAMKIGNKVFYKNEPVLYFDTLKTSALENATNTVYAQGGRGNARLIAWEGEKTITFTMEDALISPMGLSVLTGAGLVKAEEKSVIVHKTEITNNVKKGTYSSGSGQNTYLQITLKEKPYKYPAKLKNNNEDFIYVMLLDNDGNIISEPYIASEQGLLKNKVINIYGEDDKQSDDNTRENDLSKFYDGCQVLVDYYTEVTEKAYQVNITPEDFSGNFYLEASTLFRASNGIDMPAEFIIPNCKIQSNFTFTMASSGDPTTFNFVIDAFPDYTRWNKDKKVFAAIQVIEQNEALAGLERLGTPHDYKSNHGFEPYLTYTNEQAKYIEENSSGNIINMIFTSTDSNGDIYNDGLGYKNEYSLSVAGTERSITDENKNSFYITGFIPFSYGQFVDVAGFTDITDSGNLAVAQGIYFYKEDYTFICREQVNNLNNAPFEYQSKNNNIQVAKFIRVCFYNTNIKDMAVIVWDNPEEDSKEQINLNMLSNNSSDEEPDGTRSLPVEEDEPETRRFIIENEDNNDFSSTEDEEEDNPPVDNEER